MAENLENSSAGSFRKVTRTFNTISGSRRDPASVEIEVTGLSRSNVQGGQRIIRLVHLAGGDPKQMHLGYGVDEENKKVALYCVRPDTPGAMAARLQGKNVSFHLGNAFEEAPSLRPETKMQFAISDVTKDADGEPCVILYLGTGLQNRRTGTHHTTTAHSSPKNASAANACSLDDELEDEGEDDH